MEYNKEVLDNMFSESDVLLVTFEKADSTIREMKCTQNLDLIPVESHPKGPSKPPSDVVRNVWEINNGWRCFKYDKILDVQLGG